MRIAYVSTDPGVPVYGRKGCSTHVREVIRALRELGAKVHLFARRIGGSAPPAFADVPLVQLPGLDSKAGGERELASYAANDDLPGVLAAHGPFDLIYERHALWSFAAMEYARRIGVPGILEVNAPLVEEQRRHRGLEHEALAVYAAARAFHGARQVLAVSAEVAASVTETSDRDHVHVVPNGVDADRFRPGVTASRPAEAFTVGFVGTLRPWHGLVQLAEAFAILRRTRPAVRLLVVGDGPGRSMLEARLNVLGARDATEFTGSVESDAVPGLLLSMDAAVAPYEDVDGFYFSPLKIFEYMACGLPVVASRAGQIEAVIEPGQTGLLCEPGDPAALAAALEHLHDDPRLRRALGDSARAAVIEKHTWRNVALSILRLASEPLAAVA